MCQPMWWSVPKDGKNNFWLTLKTMQLGEIKHSQLEFLLLEIFTAKTNTERVVVTLQDHDHKSRSARIYWAFLLRLRQNVSSFHFPSHSIFILMAVYFVEYRKFKTLGKSCTWADSHVLWNRSKTFTSELAHADNGGEFTTIKVQLRRHRLCSFIKRVVPIEFRRNKEKVHETH